MAYGFTDTQNKNFTQEARLLLDIVQKRIESRNTPFINLDDFKRINWPLLTRMIVYHELASFAYIYFKDSSFILPGGLMDFLKKGYYLALLQNSYFEQEFFRLNRIFTENDLAVVPIKGLALLQDIYKQCPVRPMVDMDILVKEDELAKAENIITKLGYKEYLGNGSYSYWRNNNCNIPFKKERGGWVLELHFALDSKMFNGIILPDLWKRLRASEINKNKIRLLSPEDTLFSLALHQRRFGKRLSLKNTLDVALLIDKYQNNFDWDYVLKEAGSGRMCSTVFFVLFQAKVILGAAIPEFVWKALKVPFWKRGLISRLINKYTFSSHSFNKAKYVYFKSFFLLYDSLWEPVSHILHITHEEFAKFYNLPLYAPETKKLYKARFLYMPYRLVKDSFKKALF